MDGMGELCISAYSFSATWKCIVSYNSPCKMMLCRPLWRAQNPYQLPPDVIKRWKHVMDDIVSASFNMGDCNSLHTLRSFSLNMDWWPVYVLPSLRQKLFQQMDHWMKRIGAQITEIAAKMLATEQAQSNCSWLLLNCYVFGIIGKLFEYVRGWCLFHVGILETCYIYIYISVIFFGTFCEVFLLNWPP